VCACWQFTIAAALTASVALWSGQVYLRIKQAMELAEEARLERDAARATTDSLAAQLSSTQVMCHSSH
jgi:hypothetical protein